MGPAGEHEKVSSAALQVTLDIAASDRAAAAQVFTSYRAPFLNEIPGALSKQLLIRDEDVQVLHRFETMSQANDYLASSMFNDDVVVGLKPYLGSEPEIRVYDQLPIKPPPAAATGAYLEITLVIEPKDREAATGVYLQYLLPFLDTVPGALSKDLVIRDDDVQVLHGFVSTDAASAYLSSDLFTADVVAGLQPLLQTDPEIRIYEVFAK